MAMVCHLRRSKSTGRIATVNSGTLQDGCNNCVSTSVTREICTGEGGSTNGDRVIADSTKGVGAQSTD